MATAGSLLSEERFVCSICLDLFTKPVSTPCGHNFCSACIHRYWDFEDICQCPVCKRLFSSRPELHVNTMVSELVDEVRRSAEEKACRQNPTETDGIPCDICSEVKEKAVKSCLMCLTSFCALHLEPHQRVAVLKSHTLIAPVSDFNDRMCKEHGKVAELYCRGEQACICVLCLRDDHRGHDVVTLEEEVEAMTAIKDQVIAQTREMIESRSAKMTEMVASIRCSQWKVNKAKEASQQVCTHLLGSIQKIQRELFEMMDEQHRETKEEAEGFLSELQVERSELETRVAQLEQLSQSEDHLSFLLNFPALSLPPAHKDWEQVHVRTNLCVSGIDRSMYELMEKVDKAIEENPVIRAIRQKQKQKSLEGLTQKLTEITHHLKEVRNCKALLLKNSK